jgi:hypothetical protein
MTTNIFDSNGQMMATDSRWSIQLAGWLMYVDDVGYDKIVEQNGKVLMFAGFGRAIQQWKDWIASNPTGPSGMPIHKGMSVCMVDAATKSVDFEAEQDIVNNGVYCAGSGARHAYGCWVYNKCAKKAVETAKSLDFFSGGEIKYFDFKNSINNLTPKALLTNITIDTVDAAILKGGQIMKININIPAPGNPPFTMAASANSDDSTIAAEQIRAKIASGELSATAPCDGMHNDWSKENKDRFSEALGKMFGWKL